LRDWIIPIASVLLAVWFAASARKDAERAQAVLKQINEATQGWQSEIMKAATELLNTMPQTIDGKLRLADANAKNEVLGLLVGTLKKKLEEGGSADAEAKVIKELGSIARQLSGLSR
jgi:type II secretory pathway pseudopilin PulG